MSNSMDYLKLIREVLEESKSKIAESLKNPAVFKPVYGKTLLT